MICDKFETVSPFQESLPTGNQYTEDPEVMDGHRSLSTNRLSLGFYGNILRLRRCLVAGLDGTPTLRAVSFYRACFVLHIVGVLFPGQSARGLGSRHSRDQHPQQAGPFYSPAAAAGMEVNPGAI